MEFCVTVGHLRKVGLMMAEKLKHRTVPLLLMPTLKTSKITNRNFLGLLFTCLTEASLYNLDVQLLKG